ncbi:MAG TPA: cytochrome c [Pyrinomonadaceae bacterium]|jgi:cytochrome c551
MKLIKLACLLAALALFALACDNTTNTNQTSGNRAQPSPAASAPTATSASPTPAANEFAHTQEVYAQECSICHGDEGKGGLVKIEDKRLKVPSLLKGHALNHTEEQLAKQISDGGDGMPAFKEKLSKDEIGQMVRFIRQKLQAGAASAAPDARPGTKD